MDLLKQLNDAEAQETEQYARSKLNEFSKLNDVIGPQIFSILEQHSRVLYYPLEDEDVWGFVERTAKGDFVCINTSISYDKQVFVAAHELYHILRRDRTEELTLAKDLENGQISSEPASIEELKANRFAAAFLINGDLLRQEMAAFKISAKTLNLQGILRLANHFVVPFKTMVRRLFELNIINDVELSKYMGLSHSELDVMKKRIGLMTPTQDKAIALDNLTETAMTLYEQNRITVEKLEQILSYSNLSLSEMGIAESNTSSLTDAEIDALLED